MRRGNPHLAQAADDASYSVVRLRAALAVLNRLAATGGNPELTAEEQLTRDDLAARVRAMIAAWDGTD